MLISDCGKRQINGKNVQELSNKQINVNRDCWKNSSPPNENLQW